MAVWHHRLHNTTEPCNARHAGGREVCHCAGEGRGFTGTKVEGGLQEPSPNV